MPRSGAGQRFLARIASHCSMALDRVRGSPLQRERWSYPAVTVLRQLPKEFATLANYTNPVLTLTASEHPESVPGEAVSPPDFSVLGAATLLGRTFLDDEDVVPGAHPVALLSYDLWQRRFGGDPAIVGRAVSVNGVPLTVAPC
jgi:hypothetical protein